MALQRDPADISQAVTNCPCQQKQRHLNSHKFTGY
jgi:hypothetical protein